MTYLLTDFRHKIESPPKGLPTSKHLLVSTAEMEKPSNSLWTVDGSDNSCGINHVSWRNKLSVFPSKSCIYSLLDLNDLQLIEQSRKLSLRVTLVIVNLALLRTAKLSVAALQSDTVALLYVPPTSQDQGEFHNGDVHM